MFKTALNYQIASAQRLRINLWASLAKFYVSEVPANTKEFLNVEESHSGIKILVLPNFQVVSRKEGGFSLKM